MKKLALFILILILTACSGTVVKEEDALPAVKPDSEKALEFFINGQILDAQDRFEEAVVQFEKALSFDKSGGIYYSLALDYYKLKKLPWAKQAAQKAIEIDSNNKEYYFLLASIYETGKSIDSAAACYESIIKTDSLDVRATFNLAEIYKTSKPNRALALYKKLIKIMGPTPDVLFEMAAINERLGNSVETINTIQELLKLNPGDLFLKKILIETYIRIKKYDEALAVVDDLLTIYPGDFALIEYKGSILAQQGKWEPAKNEYLKIIHGTGINFGTKIKIGLAFLAQSQTDSVAAKVAKNIFEEVDKDTTDWQVKFYLAEINLSEKNDSVAAKYYREAAGLAEWNIEIWSRFGALLFDNGKYDELKKEMEKAVKIFPDNFHINLLTGLAYSQTNDHTGAKKYLSKAVSINPSDVTALSALGFSLNQLKEEDEALKYLEKALDLEPNDTQILGIIGLIYENRKKYDVSDKMYEKALTIDSTDALILNNYAYSLSERGIELEKALKMAKIAVEKESKNSSYLDTIGWIYFKLGDTEKAAKYIEDAIKNGEQSADIYNHMGDVYQSLGKIKSAVENWKKALEKDPANEKIKLKIEKGTK